MLTSEIAPTEHSKVPNFIMYVTLKDNHNAEFEQQIISHLEAKGYSFVRNQMRLPIPPYRTPQLIFFRNADDTMVQFDNLKGLDKFTIGLHAGKDDPNWRSTASDLYETITRLPYSEITSVRWDQ
jgi:hypothetical protein